MSYFPCDIPCMSKEELEENGIRIPKEQPEKTYRKDCRWNDSTCYCEFHYRDVKPTDYCSWAERRTDGR